jgi:hypothetical protein
LNWSGSCLRPCYADLNCATIQATDADIDEHRPIRVKPSGIRSRVLDRSDDGVQVNRRLDVSSDQLFVRFFRLCFGVPETARI